MDLLPFLFSILHGLFKSPGILKGLLYASMNYRPRPSGCTGVTLFSNGQLDPWENNPSSDNMQKGGTKISITHPLDDRAE